ncbi:MAG: hypothetical protein ACRESK_09755 [Gammaproteobacteria bacterium]
MLIFSCQFQGCAAPPTRTTDQAAAATGAQPSQPYWWYVRYRIAWPEKADPDWRVDLLLADAVIKPVLDANRSQIRYWRFHRRANRDEAGHQFSFIFYADKDAAGRINSALMKDKLVSKLMVKNILAKVVTDNTVNNLRTGVQDTSDKNWPETLQNAWPAYIMGVSDMWLQLITQNVDQTPPDAGVDDLLGKYGYANDRITAMWQQEGRHAFLHHLNAIFGYEPIIIEKAMQF